MQTGQKLSFGLYQLVGPQGPLLRKSLLVNLPPKALAVLWLLVSRAGQVVSKEELFAAVWPETVVGEETLTAFIGILRRTLKDDARQPRYIATVHRVGYRFIAPLSTTPPVSSSTFQVPRSKSEQSTVFRETLNLKPETILVGREAELAHLHSLFAKALNGERQVVFVTGEAGIGKTTLIDAFRQRLEAGDWRLAPSPQASSLKSLASPVSFAHGQCIEQYGAGEAYLPVLEALGRLGRQTESARVTAILEQYAPTWLVQLSTLLSAAELEAVQRRVQGATRERMLREIAEALEVLSTERPLVLVLEDLHWSDPSTVELLAMLARRREAARLLVLGTYRPVELVVTNHPLKAVKQELVARRQGNEILLGGLSRDAVQSYITQHVGEDVPQDEITRFVHKRTEGHPLFMVQVTDYLRQQNLLQALSPEETQAVPTGLQQLIEVQLERLTSDEQQVLAVASVAGAEFTVASVMVGVQDKSETIETTCESLARGGQFIDDRGVLTWPDGTISERYGFRHALYQEVLYTRLPEARRIRWHKAIGERIERGYGERTSEVAAELAVHFERGHDNDRAAVYLQKAGENALRRNAYQEALGYFHRGAVFLLRLPDTADRARRELALQFLLLQATIAVKGHASVEVERVYLHAQILCEQVGTPQQLFFVLLGLFRLRHGHCEYQLARELSAKCRALAEREHDLALFFPAYYASGASELYLGHFAAAKQYCAQGIQSYDARHDLTYTTLYGNSSPYLSCYSYVAMALWYLGFPDQALRRIAEVLQIAKDLRAPLTLAGTRAFAPLVYHCCRQGVRVQEQAEEGIAISTQMGFPFWRAVGLFWRGWSLAEQGHHEEGIAQMQQGLAAQHATGSTIHRVHFSVLLAEAHGGAGQCAEGLRLLAEAQIEMERTNERFYEAELWRIKGQLTLQKEARRWELGSSPLPSSSPNPKSQIPDPTSEAERCFRKAIDIARQQQAKSLELRAVMSLVRLLQKQVKEHGPRSTQHAPHTKLAEVHHMLSEVYGWFTEGFDTKDLQEAQTLLEETGKQSDE